MKTVPRKMIVIDSNFPFTDDYIWSDILIIKYDLMNIFEDKTFGNSSLVTIFSRFKE